MFLVWEGLKACPSPHENRKWAVFRQIKNHIVIILRPPEMEKLDTLTGVNVPGNDPYVAVKPSPFHPKANETCIQCGLCAEKCPVGAIPMDNPSQTLDEACINCMRCVQVCPVKARALPAPFLAGATKMLEEKVAGYKLPQLFGV